MKTKNLRRVLKTISQAVLGPAAVDLVRSMNDNELSENANTVFIVCVISILLTAPVGAVLIATTGPRLLSKADSASNRIGR